MTKPTKPLLLAAIAGLAISMASPAPSSAESPFGSGTRGGPPGRGGPGGSSMLTSGFGDHGPGRLLPLLLRSVELSDEQRARVEAILQAQQQKLGAQFEALRDAHGALATALTAVEPPSTTELDLRVARVNELRAALMRDGVAAVLEVRKVLTAEQLATVAEKQARLQELRDEMRSVYGDTDGRPGAH